MDKSTLSNYGWLVVVTLALAIMLALATPFGTYVGDAVVSVANGYTKASDKAIDEDNIKTNGEKWDSKFDYSGIKDDDAPSNEDDNSLKTGTYVYNTSWDCADVPYATYCNVYVDITVNNKIATFDSTMYIRYFDNGDNLIKETTDLVMYIMPSLEYNIEDNYLVAHTQYGDFQFNISNNGKTVGDFTGFIFTLVE